MIIDAHCHAGKGDGFTGPWDTSAPLDKYLQRCDLAGITHTNLLAAFHSDYQIANEQIATIAHSDPARFFAFVFVHAVRDRGRVLEMVRMFVEQHGFVGIKVHAHDARITREICETARRFALPILYDVAGDVSIVRLIAPEYPDVNFIFPHLGSFGDDWKAQSGLIEHLVQFPNVYADTAGVRRYDILEEAVHRAGASKILFGSDGPWLHPEVELSKIYMLDLNERDESLILSNNFLELTKATRSRWQQKAPSERVIHSGSFHSSVPSPVASTRFSPTLRNSTSRS